MKSRTHAITQAIFVVFLWATSWVFIKTGLKEISPLVFAGLRYFLAFIVLFVGVLFSDAKKEFRSLPAKMWWQMILLGIIFYAVTQGAIFVALDYLSAITVNLMWSFSSVVIAVMGYAWLSEKPTPVQWAGIGLAIVGACIYFFSVTLPNAQVFGVLIAVIGILANGFSSIMGRGINRSSSYPPLIVTVISMGSGSILLLASSLFVEGLPVISTNNLLILLWLATINTALAFTLWNQTLRTLTAMESSIINGTMLIWIPLFAILFLGESISIKEIFGLIAVGLGTFIVQLRRVPRKRELPTRPL